MIQGSPTAQPRGDTRPPVLAGAGAPPTEGVCPREEVTHAPWAPLFSHLKCGGGTAFSMGACLPLAGMTNPAKHPRGLWSYP